MIPVSIKLAPEVLGRADALGPHVQADPSLGPLLRDSRSTVLRLAILRGLEVLEQEYGLAPAVGDAARDPAARTLRTRP